MNWLEIMLLIFGAGAFAGSFLVRGKKKDANAGQQIDMELIREIIEKEMADAKDRVSEVVDETLSYAVEKTERASERISNEKIMAISEYSETVLADINKSHQEVMFLYDMLNDKHKNLKETVKHVDKTAKEAEEAAHAAALALAAKAREEAEAKTRENQEKEAARREEMRRSDLQGQELQDKAAREKEEARRQMARLILPMQQELPMRHPMDLRPMDRGMPPYRQFQQIAAQPAQQGAAGQITEQPELRPLVVKSVEIVSSNDMKPVPDRQNANISIQDLQKLGIRPENFKVVDVKPADLRPVEVYSFVDQAPHIERPAKKQAQAATFENSVNRKKQYEITAAETADTGENNNDRILRLHKKGMSSVDIAKELELGVGEVNLVINLFKGAE